METSERTIALAYRLLFPERQEAYSQAEAEKISYGGMLITAGEKLKVGSLVEIELRTGPEGKARLKLLGEVKWVKAAEGRDAFSTAVFYLIPTAGRMFDLFMAVNREAVDDIRASKVRTSRT